MRAIPVIYERYGKKLYAYTVVNCNLTEGEAWDLIYKTLYSVVDSYHNREFDTEDKFHSFIFKIFIDYLIVHYRQTYKEFEWKSIIASLIK